MRPDKMLEKKNWSKYIILIFLTLTSHGTYSQTFYKGVDLSYVNELEDCGVRYLDKDGKEAEVYGIFEANGANIVRLRLWHNPAWTNYSNLTDVKKSIKRAKDLGMEVLLDFHYSDFWTDPGRNWRPAVWEEIEDDAVLSDSLYNYTYHTLSELNEEGLLPEMVQIGNETNGNILIKREGIDIGNGTPNLYPINWARQSMLFNNALKAVTDLESILEKEIQTMIHIANAESAESWFANASQNGVADYDIIGLSYYPQWHNQDVRELGDYVAFFKETYNKEVMIVEVGYPWTSAGSGDAANNVLGGPSKLSTYDDFSPEVQAQFLTELTWLVKENGGAGVIYWEPAWVSSSCQTYWGTGSHWDNATLFDFENKPHAGMDFLSYDYTTKPDGLKEQEITFKVNMEGVSDINDVFVTGDFTGEGDWQFLPMEGKESDIYELKTTIPGRSSGAYIFYKNNDWVVEYREIVPDACANFWNTHRYYLVKNSPVEFNFAWGSCTTAVNELPLNLDGISKNEIIRVFPNPVVNELFINEGINIQSAVLMDAMGRTVPIKMENNTIDMGAFSNGIYFLKLDTDEGSQTIKILKND
ncbi:MAG: glycosyl hydrolase 53 family protein [Cyclobacteriaceae bacterium]